MQLPHCPFATGVPQPDPLHPVATGNAADEHTFTYVARSDPQVQQVFETPDGHSVDAQPCQSCYLLHASHLPCQAHHSHFHEYQIPLGPQPAYCQQPHHQHQYQPRPRQQQMHYRSPHYPQAYYSAHMPASSTESIPAVHHPHHVQHRHPSAHQSTSVYYGRTKAEVDYDNQQIALRSGAWKDHEMVPYRPADDQQFWVVDLDGSQLLCSYASIEEGLRPGQWRKDPLHGNLFFVRTMPDN